MFRFEKSNMNRVFLGSRPDRAAVEDAQMRIPCQTQRCICRDDDGCCTLGGVVATAGRGRGQSCEYFIEGKR